MSAFTTDVLQLPTHHPQDQCIHKTKPSSPSAGKFARLCASKGAGDLPMDPHAAGALLNGHFDFRI